MNVLGYPCHVVERVFAFRWEGKTVDLGSHCPEQKRCPSPLEACVTRKEDSAATPEVLIDHHVLHFALPLAHCSSRKVRSRRVSTGCQNPWCSKARNCSSLASRSS